MANANQPPLRVRMSIRDQIESPTSVLSLKLKSISKTLGYPLALETEWPMIWNEFEAHYPDNAIFIPSVVKVVAAWCDAFDAWLGLDENEESVDKMLGGLKNKGRLQLVLNTSSDALRVGTRFDSKKANFEILIPPTRAIPTSGLEASFSSNLLGLFDVAPKTTFFSAVSAVAEDPDWDDVTTHSPTVRPILTKQLLMQSHEDTLETLPDIATIQRPEELTKKPPYWLIVRQEQKDHVQIEGSHGPTLSLLEAYLKKWCRGEPTRVDRPAIVDIRLEESSFGLGVLYDKLTLDTSRGRAGREINATLVLAFVESALGYVYVQQVPRVVCGNSRERDHSRRVAHPLQSSFAPLSASLCRDCLLTWLSNLTSPTSDLTLLVRISQSGLDILLKISREFSYLMSSARFRFTMELSTSSAAKAENAGF